MSRLEHRSSRVIMKTTNLPLPSPWLSLVLFSSFIFLLFFLAPCVVLRPSIGILRLHADGSGCLCVQCVPEYGLVYAAFVVTIPFLFCFTNCWVRRGVREYAGAWVLGLLATLCKIRG
ncbi:hypothetical protein B0T25DRAFT_274254 [Lasiosphaeria hispida]|uniref:Transmembrane protein n=1 Tax=Lasiosphaeria hispida TaxID=260671 RepID=A0AAJ0HAY3_9PEZI|nr:hypothetical protein B0T25DRAFT_274254 [Lasiosphaeria hispida]